MIGDCTCGCGGACKTPVTETTFTMAFTVPQLTVLKATLDAGLFALRDKSVRLRAMEPSWTIGPDDLRMLRETTERQIEEATELLKLLLDGGLRSLLTPTDPLN